MAHRVRRVIGASPVLLLTATPIQNSLRELWGLVQYVDPTGTLLGDKPVFEDVFCADDGRGVAAPPGGGTEGAAHHRGAAHAAPAGTGVPGPVLRRATGAALRVPHEPGRARPLRRRHGLPPVADPACLPGQRPPVAPARLSPSHGVVDPGARREPGPGRIQAARNARGGRRRCDGRGGVCARPRGRGRHRRGRGRDDFGSDAAASARDRGDPGRTRTGRGLRPPRPRAAAGQQGGEPRAGRAHGHGPAGGPAQGRDLHRVPDDPGLPARAPSPTDGTARRGHHTVPGQQRLAAGPGSPRRVARRQRPRLPGARACRWPCAWRSSTSSVSAPRS